MTIPKTFLRTPYNYDLDAASSESALHCLEPTLAQQNTKDECDINEIVRRFGITGTLPDNFNPPQYGDFTGINTYQDALLAVRDAGESFMEMPAELRARFNNDPAQLIDFLASDANRVEATQLGLINGVPIDLSTAPNLETPPTPSPTTS